MHETWDADFFLIQYRLIDNLSRGWAEDDDTESLLKISFPASPPEGSLSGLGQEIRSLFSIPALRCGFGVTES